MGCAWSTENSETEQCCSPALQICWGNSQVENSLPDPAFKRYSLKLLIAATDNFSEGKLVPENRENTPKSVYRCWLGTENRWVAVKRFPPGAWPDAKDFIGQATRVGQVRHESLLSLIGYCCEEDERLLVAEFGVKLYIPYDTLEKHLFRRDPLTWEMRIRVALGVIEALNHCSENGLPVYHDLNTYRVFLDYKGLPRLSCFGLLKKRSGGMTFNSNNLDYIPPECLQTGNVRSPKSVIYSYGTVLLDLLTGSRHIPPRQALELIQAKKFRGLLDPWLILEAPKYFDADAKELIRLAAMCLQREPTFRPGGNALAASVAALSSSSKSPSWTRTFLSIFRCRYKSKNRPSERILHYCLPWQKCSDYHH